MNRVYIGWDSREKIAYKICKYSIKRHNAENNISIYPIKQRSLRKLGLYYRPTDVLSSTEFSITRFLVPFLSDYKGFSIFVDCDFLFKANIQNLFEIVDKNKAVSVVKHNYTPKNEIKMDGKVQHIYPRKNWSSMMVFNNEHPSNKSLNLDLVNTATPQYLHRFSWLNDNEIGEIHHEWNYLVGWYDDVKNPKALHYTSGGPWFEDYVDCEFSKDWLYEYFLKKSS